MMLQVRNCKRLLLAALLIGAAGSMAAQGCFSVGENTKVQFASTNWTRSDSHDLFQFTELQSLLKDDEILLSRAEWIYLFTERTDAYRLYGRATVGEVKGLVILPDKETWNLPEGLYFNFDDADEGYATNRYTAVQWEQMEQAGAAFLPAAGYSANGSEVLDAERYGSYWTSTPNNDDKAYCVSFDLGYLYYENMLSPSNAYRSVRTVKPWVPQAVEQVATDQTPSTKVLRNGQLLIIRAGVEYNAIGHALR